MSKRGSYLGGSTIIGPRSKWSDTLPRLSKRMKRWIRQQDESDQERERAKSSNQHQQATQANVPARRDGTRQADDADKLGPKARKKASRPTNKKRNVTADKSKITHDGVKIRSFNQMQKEYETAMARWRKNNKSAEKSRRESDD